MSDVTIRVRLDSSEARADLESLYGDMRRAPGIQGPRAPGPGGGGGGAPSQPMGGGGGFDAGALLRRLALLGGAGWMAGSIVPEAASMGRDALRSAVLGGSFGAVRSAVASRDAVAQMLGPMYGMTGSVPDGLPQQLYEQFQRSGPGAVTRGTLGIKQMLAGTVAKDIGSEALDLASESITILSDIKEAIKALAGKVGQ